MSCMKCGKEVSEGQVFCQECLAEMEKYPVKPGTPLPLPIRPREAVVHKRSYRKSRKPEEQIVSLRRWLSILCVICWILLMFDAKVAMMMRFLRAFENRLSKLSATFCSVGV